MLYKVSGNIIDTKCKIIVQQANSVGIECSDSPRQSLFDQVVHKWPTVFDQCHEIYSSFGRAGISLLGHVNYADTDDGHIVAVCFTKVPADGTFVVDCKALESCLRDIADYAYEYEMTVAIPHKLGIEISDHEWSKILDIIERCFCWSNTRCYIYQYD